jgi:hypothetical protein
MHACLRRIYGIVSRETTIYTAIYGVHVRFWPTLVIKNLFTGGRSLYQRINTLKPLMLANNRLRRAGPGRKQNKQAVKNQSPH